jgi:hypothetical protein
MLCTDHPATHALAPTTSKPPKIKSYTPLAPWSIFVVTNWWNATRWLDRATSSELVSVSGNAGWHVRLSALLRQRGPRGLIPTTALQTISADDRP